MLTKCTSSVSNASFVSVPNDLPREARGRFLLLAIKLNGICAWRAMSDAKLMLYIYIILKAAVPIS